MQAKRPDYFHFKDLCPDSSAPPFRSTGTSRSKQLNITEQLINEFELKPFQVENTLALFDEGSTVPFIARYRKERTGSLDEIQIRDLQHRYTYYQELEERRARILESIESQGKLTPELKKKIEATISKTELEDLYLPYKPKRVTRGKKAQDAGLEPLADWLATLEQPTADLETEAARFLNAEKGFDTPAKALGGACDILAERLSDDADNRKWLRELASTEGFLVSTVRKEFAEQKTKFQMYHDYREKVSALPSHRILAMLRGEREKVLRLVMEIPEDKAQARLESRLITHPSSAAADKLRETVRDALNRLLIPATETEIRKELRERAEQEAFGVFTDNLRTLLMSPPAGRKAVLGVDPGFRTGCKVVALDTTGKFLQYETIYPNEPQKKVEEAARTIRSMIDGHGIELVAVGNGTASRETERFVRDAVADYAEDKRPTVVIVNESGASVYSASEVAIKEFPDFDVTVRGAVSIARRLQDPLSELVKIDPKAIGVGQYQHDVNQTKLKSRLEEVVESSVNLVGVDVNLASEELLKYVSGLNRSLAGKVVTYRNDNGAFASREALMRVPGMGAKTFEQAAGFLRVPGSANPLDNSAVHPERYELVGMMAGQLETSIKELIGNKTALKSIDKQSFVTDTVGLPTIEDILSELEKPGRDPRAEFRYARFSDTITEIKDLTPGMTLEGTVTNVTNFGAFVDIGVHQDGLVHISQLADRFVSDPRQVVKVGQVVKVRVLEVDRELKRISLSMKAEIGEAPHQTRKKGAQQDKRREPRKKKPQASVQDLARKFGKEPQKLKTAKPKFKSGSDHA
ncbi:MAG: S1 RNA-binding domain-containing protein [Chitinivibrionales bacterium]|nr:S1 RNA-binding domain-containing protein [Chitinivibrionales bacterium]MBD3356618.1 S1 RNA-binding domain-containing protein [Chitinivibrionales bacterium]